MVWNKWREIEREISFYLWMLFTLKWNNFMVLCNVISFSTNSYYTRYSPPNFCLGYHKSWTMDKKFLHIFTVVAKRKQRALLFLFELVISYLSWIEVTTFGALLRNETIWVGRYCHEPSFILSFNWYTAYTCSKLVCQKLAFQKCCGLSDTLKLFSFIWLEWDHVLFSFSE